MSTKNERLVSLERMGGSKFVHSLPRADRALVLASLMQEGPAKRESEITYALYAFRKAIANDRPFAARKIMDRHLSTPGEAEFCKTLVSEKVAEIRRNSENGQSTLASDFEIAFGLGEDAKNRFIAAMKGELDFAISKLEKNYPYANVLFQRIINAEKERGIDVHIKDAAAGIALHHIRNRNFEPAFETIREHLLEKDGRIEGARAAILGAEVNNALSGCSEGYFPEIVSLSKKYGMFAFMQESVSKGPHVGSQDLSVAERAFSLFRAFGLGGQSTDAGNYLVNSYLGKAEAWPARFYEDYLNAARVARKIDDHETMDECVAKFLSICEENGKNDPSIYAKGVDAAIEFGAADYAISLGKGAFAGFAAQGRYSEAHKIASKMACNAHYPSVEASGQELLTATERLMMRLV